MCKATNVIVLGALIIIGILFSQYKICYKVNIDGEEVGYVASKNDFNQEIENQILNPKAKNVVAVTLNAEPKYETKLVKKSQETSENIILASLKENAITTYTRFAITINGESKEYVDTQEEAEQVVNEIKGQYKGDSVKLDIGVLQEYTQDLNEMPVVELASAKQEIEKQVKENVEIQKHTVNGILLATTPVRGSITSRYGSLDSIRSYRPHTGTDIAVPTGTPIKACGDGTVTFAGYSSGLGNYIIINHGNNVETYYGHCSKLYVSKGEKVESGKVIAAAGSTGNSSGSHLHLEIHVNGKRINPQSIFY